MGIIYIKHYNEDSISSKHYNFYNYHCVYSPLSHLYLDQPSSGHMDELFYEDPLTDSASGVPNGNSSITLSCAASSLQANQSSPFPPDIEVVLRSVQVLVSIFRDIFGILLNSLVIILVVKFKKLRNISFGIAVQIAIVNILLTLQYSSTTIHVAAGRYIFDSNLCIASAFVLLTLFYLRNYLILTFALDRFGSVFIPFHYPKCRHRIVTAICITFFCLSLGNSIIITPPFLDCYELIRNTEYCNFSRSCNHKCQIYDIFIILTHDIPTLLFPPVIFVALYIKGRIIKKKLNNMLGQNQVMSEEDWRALKTFSLLVSMAILFTVAIVGYLVLTSLFPELGVVYTLIGSLFSFLVVVDPIIILKNADVREVLGQLMKEIRESLSQSVSGHPQNEWTDAIPSILVL